MGSGTGAGGHLGFSGWPAPSFLGSGVPASRQCSGPRVGGGGLAGPWPLTCLRSSRRSDGRRTSHWGSPRGSCTPGGGACGAAGGREGAGTDGAWSNIVPSAAHSVFWDLYCAAPDRREACEHSGEAKAFQDYVSAFLGVVRLGWALWPLGRAWSLVPAAPFTAASSRGPAATTPQAVLLPASLCSAGWGWGLPVAPPQTLGAHVDVDIGEAAGPCPFKL